MCRWIIPPKPKKEEMEPIEPPLNMILKVNH